MAQECNKQAQTQRPFALKSNIHILDSHLHCYGERILKMALLTTVWSIISDRNVILCQQFDKCGLVPFFVFVFFKEECFTAKNNSNKYSDFMCLKKGFLNIKPLFCFTFD